MNAVDLLESVLAGTGDLIDGVRADQRELATPCGDYDVTMLVDHLVGWVQVFAAGSQGRSFAGDPAGYRSGDDPAGEFRATAADLVAGWREHGLDRMVALTGAELPGEVMLNMTLMEYLTHGWDLAVATGQPIPFTEDEAEQVLTRARATLPPEYRGVDRAFGEIVPVDEHAPAMDRLVGFMGRHPQGSA